MGVPDQWSWTLGVTRCNQDGVGRYDSPVDENNGRISKGVLALESLQYGDNGFF